MFQKKFVVRNEKSEVVRTGEMIDEKDVGFFGGFKLRMRMIFYMVLY